MAGMSRFQRVLFTLLAATAFTTMPLVAQTVCVTGELQPVPGPTLCQQGETHWLPAEEVYLRSTGVNLQQYVGRTVTVHGTDIGLLCRVLDVRQVDDPAPVQLVSCGSPSLSCPFRVAVQGPGIGFAVLAASFSRGFTPLGCPVNDPIQGTLLLGAPAEIVALGPTGTGNLGLTIQIPANNALVGATVVFQGAHNTIGPVGPVILSNLVELRVTPLLPPCGAINC